MQRSTTARRTRRLTSSALGIATSPPAVAVGGPLWSLRWLGVHGGAGVSALVSLTGIGHDAGAVWPADDGSQRVPVVVVCRATGTGSAACATAIEQWRTAPALRHVDLLGLVVVAASPRPVPNPVTARLLLMAGWVPNHWWVGWQDAYVAADDVRTVGPSPDVIALRDSLTGLVNGASS